MLAALIATRSSGPVILTTTLPPATVGIPYSTLLLASGGAFPYTWSVISGSLPPGLTLNPSTGEISGVPTAAGSYTFTVQVTDAHGATATQILTLLVQVGMYGNQLVASTTTFACIALTKRAAFISTNPSYSYQLLFSTQGNEAVLSKLQRFYYDLVSANASNSPAYLSNTIIQVIEAVFILNNIVQALPVALVNQTKLAEIQRETALAYRVLLTLSIPITLNFT
jgi:hypothetical protein